MSQKIDKMYLEKYKAFVGTAFGTNVEHVEGEVVLHRVPTGKIPYMIRLGEGGGIELVFEIPDDPLHKAVFEAVTNEIVFKHFKNEVVTVFPVSSVFGRGSNCIVLKLNLSENFRKLVEMCNAIRDAASRLVNKVLREMSKEVIEAVLLSEGLKDGDRAEDTG